MRVGILTFHRTTNYGAVLQTYALQNYLQRLGVDAEVIDYTSETLRERYKKTNPLRLFNPRELRRLIKYNSFYRDNSSNFNMFLQEHVRLSKQKYDETNINNAGDLYDYYMVGSDQIWNSKVSGSDLTFFLNFVSDDNKKISYAASFGISNPDDQLIDWCKGSLTKIRNVSVREKSGIDVYKQITGKSCINVVDPTFLLDSKKWFSISEQTERVKQLPERYVLVYCMRESKELFMHAKEIAKRIDAAVVYINERYLKKNGIINLFYVSPQEWLELFNRATYVVTNSFHGTAFSIILKKQFSVELLPFTTGVNNRITDLLGLLDLKERIIVNKGNVAIRKINYDIVEDLLANEIKKSKNYLEESIQINLQK